MLSLPKSPNHVSASPTSPSKHHNPQLTSPLIKPLEPQNLTQSGRRQSTTTPSGLGGGGSSPFVVKNGVVVDVVMPTEPIRLNNIAFKHTNADAMHDLVDHHSINNSRKADALGAPVLLPVEEFTQKVRRVDLPNVILCMKGICRRLLNAFLLRKLGFKVEHTNSGRVAALLIRSNPGKYTMVITERILVKGTGGDDIIAQAKDETHRGSDTYLPVVAMIDSVMEAPGVLAAGYNHYLSGPLVLHRAQLCKWLYPFFKLRWGAAFTTNHEKVHTLLRSVVERAELANAENEQIVIQQQNEDARNPKTASSVTSPVVEDKVAATARLLAEQKDMGELEPLRFLRDPGDKPLIVSTDKCVRMFKTYKESKDRYEEAVIKIKGLMEALRIAEKQASVNKQLMHLKEERLMQLKSREHYRDGKYKKINEQLEETNMLLRAEIVGLQSDVVGFQRDIEILARVAAEDVMALQNTGTTSDKRVVDLKENLTAANMKMVASSKEALAAQLMLRRERKRTTAVDRSYKRLMESLLNQEDHDGHMPETMQSRRQTRKSVIPQAIPKGSLHSSNQQLFETSDSWDRTYLVGDDHRKVSTDTPSYQNQKPERGFVPTGSIPGGGQSRQHLAQNDHPQGNESYISSGQNSFNGGDAARVQFMSDVRYNQITSSPRNVGKTTPSGNGGGGSENTTNAAPIFPVLRVDIGGGGGGTTRKTSRELSNNMTPQQQTSARNKSVVFNNNASMTSSLRGGSNIQNNSMLQNNNNNNNTGVKSAGLGNSGNNSVVSGGAGGKLAAFDGNKSNSAANSVAPSHKVFSPSNAQRRQTHGATSTTTTTKDPQQPSNEKTSQAPNRRTTVSTSGKGKKKSSEDVAQKEDDLQQPTQGSVAQDHNADGNREEAPKPTRSPPKPKQSRRITMGEFKAFLEESSNAENMVEVLNHEELCRIAARAAAGAVGTKHNSQNNSVRQGMASSQVETGASREEGKPEEKVDQPQGLVYAPVPIPFQNLDQALSFAAQRKSNVLAEALSNVDVSALSLSDALYEEVFGKDVEPKDAVLTVENAIPLAAILSNEPQSKAAVALHEALTQPSIAFTILEHMTPAEMKTVFDGANPVENLKEEIVATLKQMKEEDLSSVAEVIATNPEGSRRFTQIATAKVEEEEEEHEEERELENTPDLTLSTPDDEDLPLLGETAHIAQNSSLNGSSKRGSKDVVTSSPNVAKTILKVQSRKDTGVADYQDTTAGDGGATTPRGGGGGRRWSGQPAQYIGMAEHVKMMGKTVNMSSSSPRTTLFSEPHSREVEAIRSEVIDRHKTMAANIAHMGKIVDMDHMRDPQRSPETSPTLPPLLPPHPPPAAHGTTPKGRQSTNHVLSGDANSSHMSGGRFNIDQEHNNNNTRPQHHSDETAPFVLPANVLVVSTHEDHATTETHVMSPRGEMSPRQNMMNTASPRSSKKKTDHIASSTAVGASLIFQGDSATQTDAIVHVIGIRGTENAPMVAGTTRSTSMGPLWKSSQSMSGNTVTPTSGTSKRGVSPPRNNNHNNTTYEATMIPDGYSLRRKTSLPPSNDLYGLTYQEEERPATTRHTFRNTMHNSSSNHQTNISGTGGSLYNAFIQLQHQFQKVTKQYATDLAERESALVIQFEEKRQKELANRAADDQKMRKQIAALSEENAHLKSRVQQLFNNTVLVGKDGVGYKPNHPQPKYSHETFTQTEEEVKPIPPPPPPQPVISQPLTELITKPRPPAHNPSGKLPRSKVAEEERVQTQLTLQRSEMAAMDIIQRTKILISKTGGSKENGDVGTMLRPVTVGGAPKHVVKMSKPTTQVGTLSKEGFERVIR